MQIRARRGQTFIGLEIDSREANASFCYRIPLVAASV
jgi:hypothetical protein